MAYRPLRQAPRLSVLITRLYWDAYLLQNGMTYLVGPETKSFLTAFEHVPAFVNQSVQIGNISIGMMQIVLWLLQFFS